MSNRKKSGGRGKHKEKKEEEPKGLAYKIINEAQTKELLELSVDEVQVRLQEILNLASVSVDLKDGAVLDYHTSNFWWAKEKEFTCPQVSAFVTLSSTLLDNIKDKNMSLVENLIELKKCLRGVGQENPEQTGGLDCFNMDQGKAISDYFQLVLFQHYKLFEFIFTHSQAEEIIGLDLDIEVAQPADLPWPAPLDEAVPEEMYQEYIATPPPTPTPEVTDELSLDMESHELTDKEKEIFSSLTPDQVKEILESVCKELLSGLEAEVVQKLKEKENSFINQINKIHKIAET
ncbi:ciliary-associated calcium-binding coiled-coil protein 1-like isoform X2 [Tubulanus polymorphus]|uniref:ciliary-associated calcium-binding coiled-coil protein 1-like isoform X2 n=1 Tax=Tubulanus polymorphus TaxID=672921 RepID=UPI003DA4D8FB